MTDMNQTLDEIRGRKALRSQKKPPDLTFQQHVADFLVRAHGVLDPDGSG